MGGYKVGPSCTMAERGKAAALYLGCGCVYMWRAWLGEGYWQSGCCQGEKTDDVAMS